MSIKKISTTNNDFDGKLFLLILKKNLLITFLLLIIALIGSFLYLRYTHPTYEASSIIQVNTDDQTDKLLNTSSITQDNIEQKVDFLRSTTFLQRALSKLPLAISYYSKGDILSYELYKNSPFEVTANVKNSSIYGIKFNVTILNEKDFLLSYPLSKNNTISEKHAFGDTIINPDVDLCITLRNNLTNKPTEDAKKIDYFFIVNHPDNIVPSYVNNLKIHILNKAAQTIKINYKGGNALKSAEIVNTIAEEFKEYDRERKQESTSLIINFIDDQLGYLYDSLSTSETSLEDFKNKNNINLLLLQPLETIQTHIGDLENQMIGFDLEERVVDQIQESLTKENVDVHKLLALLMGGEFKKEFKEGIATSLDAFEKLLLQKQQLLYEVTPSSGQIKAIDYKIEVHKKILIETIQTLKNNMQSRKLEIRKLIGDYQNMLVTAYKCTNTVELNKLQRQFAINEKIFNQLIESRTTYTIAKAGYISQHIILEKARHYSSPVSPLAGRTYMLFLATGLLLSLLLVVIHYLFYNEIVSIEDITRYTHTPILGAIPKYHKEIPISQLIVDKKPKSIIAEALRSIRTNLQFISNEPGAKIIALTSTLSGEGKTFVAINLAGVLAFSEKKVIVIDLDMRKPKIHLGFSVDNDHGISTIIAGKDSFEQCIHKTSIKNLDFITAGPIPPNPSELILSDRMEALLIQLKSNYDFIIIDNPPIGLVTDAMRSLQKADYPIYVFKAGYSKKMYIQHMDKLINDSNIKKLSLILNGVESINKKYGYGYGYYEEDTEVENTWQRIKKLFS